MRFDENSFLRVPVVSGICGSRRERKLLAGSNKRLRGFNWGGGEYAMTEIENVAFAAQLAENLLRCAHDIFVRPEQNGGIEISL
jgi:hypothetical protein